jgi:hypothetical protein
MEHAILITIVSAKRLLRILPIIGCSVALAACAMNPADARSSTPERTAETGQICQATMGLSPSNTDYDLCQLSLLQTMASLDQASLVQRDRQACMERGLTPNTAAFAECVVDAENPASN